VLYYAFGPSIRSKFVKHNTSNYLLLHIKVGYYCQEMLSTGLQPLESNKYQVEFDPGERELVSTYE